MWRRGGVQEPIPGEPQWPIDVLWIPPLPRPPWKTDQWDRIQTSEVESQWYPVMRGWTGGSDDWQCQKRQTDPAEWGLMIWNLLLQFAGLQWPIVAQSQLNGPLLKPDCLAVQFVVLWKKQWDLVEDNWFECFGYEWKERYSIRYQELTRNNTFLSECQFIAIRYYFNSL